VTEELGRKMKGNGQMTSNEKALRSEAAAVVFFTALSSVTALAAAILPFFIA
jgi:hypothetical protein